MALLEVDFRPGARVLRQFGLAALVVFGLLAALAWWRSTLFGFELGERAAPVAVALLGVALLSGLFAWLAPWANRPLYLLLVFVTWPIGFVLSYLVLGILFFAIFTPVGLFFRLVGRDALNSAFDPEARTYWVDRDPQPHDPARYFKQF